MRHMKKEPETDYFEFAKDITRRKYQYVALQKRIYDLETALVQIKELCGIPDANTPLEIHMIIELCDDNLKK